MADASKRNEQQQGGSGGISKSTPLVTVSNVHSGVRTAVTPAGTDHPLATPPHVEVSEKPPASVPTAAATIVSPPPQSVAKTTPSSPATTPTVVQVPPTPPPPSSSSSTAKKQATSLEAMADEFLSGPSARTEAGMSALLKPAPLPKEEQGIARMRTLVTRRAWGDVLQVCGAMLRGSGSSSSSPYTQLYTSLVSDSNVDVDAIPDHVKQETVEILTMECQAWLKLRRYNELGREIDRWNFLSNNDSNADSPSWIPWSLHILAAESLQYTDPTSTRCTDVLFSLRETLKERNETKWFTSVDNALANAFIRRKEWRLALIALDDMMESLPAAVRESLTSKTGNNDMEAHVKLVSDALRCEVRSRQGRIMLQLGALPQAATLFGECKTLSNTMSTESCSEWIVTYVPIQIRINDGLFCFAHGQYDQAMTHFRKSIEMLRAHAASSPSYHVEDWMGPTLVRVDAYHTALSNCWNDLALCALYTCRMQDAVRMMESLIREDPSAFLTERLAFNLSTLYELGSDAAASTRKKRVLQVIAKRFFLHDIGPESFRVS